jgi:hypothetical protein
MIKSLKFGELVISKVNDNTELRLGRQVKCRDLTGEISSGLDQDKVHALVKTKDSMLSYTTYDYF